MRPPRSPAPSRARAEEALGVAQRRGVQRGELADTLVGARLESVGVHDLRDQTVAERGRPVDPGPGGHHVERALTRDRTGEPADHDRRRIAGEDLGEREPRAFRGEREVGVSDEPDAEPRGVALNLGDDDERGGLKQLVEADDRAGDRLYGARGGAWRLQARAFTPEAEHVPPAAQAHETQIRL